MTSGDPSVKVTDRRQFTADGVLKDEAPESRAAAFSPPPEAATASPLGSEDPAASGISFAAFIVSLATQAAELLGGESKDPGGARQIIGVIEMLKEKTEGRRTDEETRLMDAVLFDLRMAFVGLVTGVPQGHQSAGPLSNGGAR